MLNVKLFEHFSTRYFVFLGDFLKITKINRNKKKQKVWGRKESPPQAKKFGVSQNPPPLKIRKNKKRGVWVNFVFLGTF